MAKEPADIKQLSAKTLAKLLSASYRRNVTVEQVDNIAIEGSLFAKDKTINLYEFIAYLLKGENNDS